MKNGMNIRFEPELRERLGKVAEKSGLKVSDILRMALSQYIERVEKTGQLTINIGSIEGDNKGQVIHGGTFHAPVVINNKKNSDQHDRVEAAKKAASKNIAKVKGNGNKISQQ